MKFNEALQLIERKEGIIGTTTDAGVKIDSIIIVPVNEKECSSFFTSLMLTRNPQQAIVPFMNSDVRVMATNTKILYEKGVFCYKVLEDEINF